MYEIIEKNQYGVLVKNTTNYGDCFFCKYEITQCNNRYKCINDSYYLPDSEAEKLESEKNILVINEPFAKFAASPKEYLFVESNTSLSIDPNKINTSVFQFHQNGNVILEFKANGDIFIKGELVENNIDVVNMLKDICNGKYVQQTDSDTQKELIDLRVELRVEKEKSKALEEYSRGLELKVKELEGTIENMKAIAINMQQPEQCHTVTSVDYPSDNETEVIDSPYSSVIGQWLITKCCSFLIKDNFNYCPNCGRKIKK